MKTDAEIIAAALAAGRESAAPDRDVAERLVAIDREDAWPFGTSSRDRAHARQMVYLCRSQYLATLRCPACEAEVAPVDFVRHAPSSPKNACPSCSVELSIGLGLMGDVWLERQTGHATREGARS